MTLADTYGDKYSRVLVPVALELERLLKSYFDGVPRIDRVYARAKAPDKFLEKAARQENGTAKYCDPENQIQDQIGARVICLYQSDIDPAVERAEKYFMAAEKGKRKPESDSEFGYFGMHLILPIPGDAVPAPIDRREVPRMFELQIRTLFQHAWSEANHDIGYKSPRELTRDERRGMAFASAQAWGADDFFDRLHRARVASRV